MINYLCCVLIYLTGVTNIPSYITYVIVIIILQLRNYKIRTTSGESLGFRICDTMGLEDDGGLMLHDIPYILDGNVDDHFQVCVYFYLNGVQYIYGWQSQMYIMLS